MDMESRHVTFASQQLAGEYFGKSVWGANDSTAKDIVFDPIHVTNLLRLFLLGPQKAFTSSPRAGAFAAGAILPVLNGDVRGLTHQLLNLNSRMDKKQGIRLLTASVRCNLAAIGRVPIPGINPPVLTSIQHNQYEYSTFIHGRCVPQYIDV